MILKILSHAFLNRLGGLSLVLFSLLTFVALFIFAERALIYDVITGTFPLTLFLTILPGIFSNFFFADGGTLATHYVIISLLFGMYITLLLEIFLRRKYVSLSSLSGSVAGLVGISLGVSCLSCGVLGEILLFSIIGALTSSTFIALESQLFLILGELLLLASVVLALEAIKRAGYKY